MNEEKEIWKTYPEIEWLQGSRFGDVRTLDHYVVRKNGYKYFVKGHVLPQQHREDGYMQVDFYANGEHARLSVHRIIATCFLGNPDNLPQVNHIDCDPTNNAVSNLEWCDGYYNQQYVEKHGKARGHHIIAINLKTLEALQFTSQYKAVRQLGVDRRRIYDVIKGYLKQTKGFWFTNADENAVKNTRTKFGNEIAEKVAELITEK